MEAPIVATRTTFDGVTIFFHEDGEVSNRRHFYRGRLPKALIFTVADNLCTYMEIELPALLRDAKVGRYPRPVNRGTGRIDPLIWQGIVQEITYNRSNFPTIAARIRGAL
jgi:hypothetical protein